AARAPLASATDEWARHAARVGTGFLAVPRSDSDGLIAAISLAGIDPARVAPARVLRREGAAREGEQGDGGESRDARGTSHRRGAVWQEASDCDHAVSDDGENGRGACRSCVAAPAAARRRLCASETAPAAGHVWLPRRLLAPARGRCERAASGLPQPERG